MLASPSRSIEDLGEQLTRLVRRNGGGTSDPISLQVEDKYDGERVQIHYNPDSGKPAMAFSRNLKPLVPTKFNAVRDVLPAAFPGVKSLIVDGEVLVIDKSTGEPLPFGTLGVHKFAALPSTASVCVVVFDILLLDGEPLLNKPLSVRRDVLSRVLKRVPHRVELANARVATNWGAVEV
jgi:DNA ligase-3